MPETIDPQIALISEQLRHALDLQQARIDAIIAKANEDRQLTNLRLTHVEDDTKDHEDRLRANTDGVTQFKLIAGIGGGAGILGIISLIKSFFGS